MLGLYEYELLFEILFSILWANFRKNRCHSQQ
jgi:hypothetical protein